MALGRVMYDLEWRSFGTYLETDDGWFVPDPAAPYTPRSYLPADAPGLVSAVAHLFPITRDDEHTQSILDFLRDYGCLGQTSLSNQRRHIEQRPVDGDSRVWLELHGGAVRLVMSLYEADENGDAERLQNLLGKLNDSQLKTRSTFLPAGDGHVLVELPLQDYKTRPKDTAQGVIDAILNLNLGGVDRAVQRGKDVFRFKALVQLVYWRLRDELAAARPVRQCMGCGRSFFIYDSRQKFCSPPPFAKESRCAVKRRVLKHRAKTESVGAQGERRQDDV